MMFFASIYSLQALNALWGDLHFDCTSILISDSFLSSSAILLTSSLMFTILISGFLLWLMLVKSSLLIICNLLALLMASNTSFESGTALYEGILKSSGSFFSSGGAGNKKAAKGLFNFLA